MSKRASLDTELKNALSGREVELCAAILARVCGTTAAAEKRDLESWYEAAAEALADVEGLASRVEKLSDLERVTLALLVAHPWWSRVALAQAVGLLRPTADASGDTAKVGQAVADTLRGFPVLVRTNSWTRTEELSLFEPLSTRLRGLVESTLAVGHARLVDPLPDAGLGRTLLALALFPGLVAQRRPRVTRGGDLHAADATRLERTLGDARGMYATWDRLHAFEEIDGALAPIATRCRALLDDPSGLVAELLRHRLSDLGWELAALAASAPEGHGCELGAALLSVGLRSRFAYGLDPAALVQHVTHEDLRFSPFVLASMRDDTLAIPRDVRAAVRGEPIALAGSAGFVQPNYEVVIPPGAPLGPTFVVGCAAELRHLEAVARLELTRESVLAARAVGVEPAQIVAALEAISAPRPLPPAVRHAIEEWGAAVGEARVRTAVLFDVRASEALLEVVARELEPLVVDRPAPRLFVLSRAPTPRELARLRDAGVITRAVASAGQRPERDDDDDRPAVAPFALSAGRRPLRDLRDDVDPYRTTAVVEASRPKKGSAPARDTRPGAIDPDDGGERPLPPLVRVALEERRTALAARPELLGELRKVEASGPFRRAAATNPSALALAIRRASDPTRLTVEVARLVAEASMRRASD